MTYQNWLTSLNQRHDENYWDNIIRFAPEITKDLALKKQYKVAKSLRLEQSKLSILAPLIKHLGLK